MFFAPVGIHFVPLQCPKSAIVMHFRPSEKGPGNKSEMTGSKTETTGSKSEMT